MLTGIKGSGFSVAGSALQTGAVIPGTIGDGFIWVGNKFVLLAHNMSKTGARWKVYGDALCDLEAGKFTEADVTKTMEINNVDYRTAVIACAKAFAAEAPAEVEERTETPKAAGSAAGLFKKVNVTASSIDATAADIAAAMA